MPTKGTEGPRARPRHLRAGQGQEREDHARPDPAGGGRGRTRRPFRRRRGARRRRRIGARTRRIAFSSPQPPGSTMKVITTVAALEEDIVKLDDTFPVESENSEIGRTIENASDELCGGTSSSRSRTPATPSSRRSEPRSGARSSSPPQRVRLQLAAGSSTTRRRPRRSTRRESTIPPDISRQTSTSASARSARARCWQRRFELASVAQRSQTAARDADPDHQGPRLRPRGSRSR